MSLSDCFKKYQEKINIFDGTDKNTVHSYSDLYDLLLNPKKDIYRNIIEIGVASGGSCAAFADFFSNATIYGIDINFFFLKHGNQHPNIKYIQMNAANPEILDKLVKPFDLVLDDGSHQPYEQIDAARLFVPFLSKDGMYICEDINQSHQDMIRTEFQIIANKNKMNLDWYDLRHIKNRFDDIVAVFHY
jgi:predicted O-methyltransferase YrrM